jgi:ParB family chromosome partitioning protein
MSSPAAAALARLELSERLRQRRLETLPLSGPGAVFTEVQGRGPGESTRPAALVDLISSISSYGVLQPVFVEEIPSPNGPRLRLVLGERRLRACRWGAAEDPDNPNFAGLPAVICPGPLSDEDIRSWQLIENLAREPLQPGELAEALLLERCAMLTTRLLSAGIVIPQHAATLDDAVQRWAALQGLCPGTGSDANLGAPWSDVILRLGLHLNPRKARLLVEAFRTLPREISTDMDAHRISLTARTRYAQLFRGREDAAKSLWAAVAARGATNLLPTAVAQLMTAPTLEPAEALEAAQAAAVDANHRRGAALARPPQGGPAEEEPSPRTGNDDAEAADLVDDVNADVDVHTPITDTDEDVAATATSSDPEHSQAVDSEVVGAVTRNLSELLEQLRAGAQLSRYDTGTLTLLVTDLRALAQLDQAAPVRGDGRRIRRDQPA